MKDGRNWYVYCDSNPLTWVDPTGERRFPPDKLTGALQAIKNGDWELFVEIAGLLLGIHVPDEVKDFLGTLSPIPGKAKSSRKMMANALEHIEKFDAIKREGRNGNSVLKEVKEWLRTMSGHREPK